MFIIMTPAFIISLSLSSPLLFSVFVCLFLSLPSSSQLRFIEEAALHKSGRESSPEPNHAETPIPDLQLPEL
jgi:hypothetical protein